MSTEAATDLREPEPAIDLREPDPRDPEAAIDLREPTAADCDAAAACQIAAWAETYAGLVPPHVLAAFAGDVRARAASWRARIARRELVTLLACARADGRVVGFATAGRAAGAAGRKELHSAYVLRAWQGRGVGRRLVDGVLGGARVAAEVWLLEGNVEARAWYERRGFGREPVERRMNAGVERWEMLLVRE